jgi:FtsH-binding integral membrane protein
MSRCSRATACNDASQGGDVAERAAITGALSLYLNFINLFTLLLQLLGQRD